jgi:hypothetical protein
LVGGVAASQTTDERLSAGEGRVTLWQYDAGVELAPWTPGPAAHGWRVAPFAGAGIGGRTYEYAQRSLPRHDALAGYLSAGAELRPTPGRRAGVRAEGRAYVSHAEGGDRGGQRTDAVLAAALTYHFR